MKPQRNSKFVAAMFVALVVAAFGAQLEQELILGNADVVSVAPASGAMASLFQP